MAVSISRRLGWKRTKGKSAPKLGITGDQASMVIYGAASMLPEYDLSLTTDEHVSKNYSEAAIDALLLKRTQLLQ
jgi:hypothetical protein